MAERKKFRELNIPFLQSQVRILGDEKELMGRNIKLDLARRMRGKGLTVTFKVFKKEKELIGVPIKMELVKSYLARIMRKRTDYVEDSFITSCSDLKVTVKPFLITRKRVSRAVRKNLRKTAKEFLIDYLKDRGYNDICGELRDGVLQRNLLPKLKKVYPLSFCDIRIFETGDFDKIDISAIEQNSLIENEEERTDTEDSEGEALQEDTKEEENEEDGKD